MRKRSVGRTRGGDGAVTVDGDERIDCRLRLHDARKRLLGELDARDRARCERVTHFADRAHGYSMTFGTR